MSVFRCNKCENIFDADYVGIYEDPTNDCANLCESCIEEYACMICGDANSLNYFEGSEESICSSCLSE